MLVPRPICLLAAVIVVMGEVPLWLQTEHPKLLRFEVSERAVPYVRMTQREVGMAKRGEGQRAVRINRYWDWKAAVGWAAKAAGLRRVRPGALVTVRCQFYLTSPLPDCDNLVKGILDALKGVAYDDDRQVREEYGALLVVRRKSSERTIVWVGELEDVHRWEERANDGELPTSKP